jgi:diaminopimelate decarboxylase
VRHFEYRDNQLHCEDVPLARIAAEFGTPCYVYSHATLERHFRAIDEPFAAVPHLTCYSVKACFNIAILRLIARLGGGFDIVSGGELFRVLRAGGDPAKVVYSGVGKTEEEIGYALESGILLFNVESEAELFAIEKVAAAQGKPARIALRVNPEVDPRTHPYVATGLRESKFGVSPEVALRLYRRALTLPHVEPVGVDCHIGSQLTQTAPFVEAMTRLVELVGRLREIGVNVRYLDVGGGLGITYRDERPPLPREYADEILAVVRHLGVSLILEPGRVIVGNAAVLLSRVLYRKDTAEKKFVIVDAAMNDCIRPSLYGAFHDLLPVDRARPEGEPEAVDVVGPICESGDFLAKNRPLPPLLAGELVAVMTAGAYCASMASNYNSRPRAAEVLVQGGEAFLIRRRESREDLVRGEEIPAFMRA